LALARARCHKPRRGRRETDQVRHSVRGTAIRAAAGHMGGSGGRGTHGRAGTSRSRRRCAGEIGVWLQRTRGVAEGADTKTTKEQVAQKANHTERQAAGGAADRVGRVGDGDRGGATCMAGGSQGTGSEETPDACPRASPGRPSPPRGTRSRPSAPTLQSPRSPPAGTHVPASPLEMQQNYFQCSFNVQCSMFNVQCTVVFDLRVQWILRSLSRGRSVPLGSRAAQLIGPAAVERGSD
jgi:hypothetical protein